MTLDAKTFHDAACQIERLRSAAPFRFGGRWFISIINGQCHAYRSKRPLVKKAIKAGLSQYTIAILG